MSKRLSFYRVTAKLLVMIVVMLQGFSLMEVSCSYSWNTNSYADLFQRMIEVMSPATVDAAEIESSAEQSIFGPKKYLRTTGKTQVYQDIFHAVPGAGTMVVRNGEADSKHRVTSALIFVNGVQLYGPKDFKQDVYVLDLPLDLQEVNDISVELRSKPSTYLTIEFLQQPPQADLNIMPDTIILGESAELSWSSQMAAGCEISPDVGAVNLNGRITVSPAVTTTYTLIASAPAGSAIDRVTVTVIPPPTANFSATPTTIIEGESTTLSWNTEHANDVSINKDIGPVDVNGSMTVSPIYSTTYTLTAVGPGGSVSKSVEITVIPPPTVTFSATPMTMIEGGPVTLSWASKHADTVTIEPMIGTVQANGSTKVKPSQTTTYTITASGPGGTTSDSTTVNIIPKEKASIRVNYTYDKKGQLEEAATLISIDD